MIDHGTSKVRLSSAFTKKLTDEETSRLHDRFTRARPFIKNLVKVIEDEIEKTIKQEETAASVENPYMLVNTIGKRAGLRQVLDLIKDK